MLDGVQRGATDILFVSPERLAVARFCQAITKVPISVLAVDEAHCISEWGHDFRPAYRQIARFSERLACPTLALTASATPPVRADITQSLSMRRPLEIVRSFDRPNLWWAVVPVRNRAQRIRNIRRFALETPGCGIVYAPTRRSVELVRDHLAAAGVSCDSYHAGLGGEERSRVQERFMSGRSRVVVATNAFGMGIDKADVRFVIHLQLPSTLEGYYQEAGRAGRDGAESACIAFHDRSDRRLAMGFVERSHPPPRRLRSVHRTLLRLAGDQGIVRVDSAEVEEVLGGYPGDWLGGEPTGPLGALERIGAVRRLGTDDGRSVSSYSMVGVRTTADLAGAARLRRRATTKLAAVERFARTRRCRRNALLRYFGEIVSHPCKRCDACGWDPESGLPCL